MADRSIDKTATFWPLFLLVFTVITYTHILHVYHIEIHDIDIPYTIIIIVSYIHIWMDVDPGQYTHIVYIVCMSMYIVHFTYILHSTYHIGQKQFH